MLSLGDLSPMVTIESKIQSQVAKFLSMKEPIVKLASYPSPSVRSEAINLLADQNRLELELKTNLSNIEKFKQGAWSVSDVISLTSFAYALDKHMKKVKDLQASTGVYTLGPSTGAGFSIGALPPWASYAGLALFFYAGYKLLRKA